VLARLFKFAAAGALLGVVVGHLLYKPVYLSRGYLTVSASASQSNAAPAAPRQPLTLSIITTALRAARQDSSGTSLPSSPSDALDHAAIDFGQANDNVEISYRAPDADAAACMAREIIKAYMDLLATGTAGTPPSVKIIAAPVEGRPLRDTSFAVTYGIVGGGIGITLCAALALLRTVRP
jgi:hypothetical protein